MIDESQDLSRIQIDFIKELYNFKSHSSFIFIADVAQSIYSHAWLVKGRSFASIGFDMTGKSHTLSKNYRTTTQIAQAAYSLIANDKNIVEDDNFVKPSLIDRQGKYPIYRGFSNKESEAKFITSIINKDLQDLFSYKEVAIIARTKEQLLEIKTYLDNQSIPNKLMDANEAMDFDSDSIKLLTMHAIKGLEFKVVFIVGLNNKTMPLINTSNEFDDREYVESRDRKLLYVGMTRATELLYLTSDGVTSKFVGDISYKYLKLNSNASIRRFHRIQIDKFLFQSKIIDLYSQEELIRQWILNELKEVYKYPIDLMDIEYNVNLGSKIGLVDAVVYIYKNTNKIPYIFIETKRWASGTEIALAQLKSYMSNCQTVQYGIATDGNDIKIINKEFEDIEDIPIFNTSMMPSSIETFEYIDLKHGKRRQIIRDSYNVSDLDFSTDGGENEYFTEDLKNIKIYSKIAAGIPIEINEYEEGEFILPSSWLKGTESTFILNVKGDSMIDAEIDNGDYVVINKQPIANSGEIVAVDIDGHATLKRFRPMGGNILLIAENEKYEPIILDNNDAKIIGVAVGIIKNKLNRRDL